MTDIDLVNLLYGTELFGSLGEEQVKAVARAVEFREYPAGHKIVRQSEAGEEFFIIASGAAQVLVEDATLNTQQVVLTLESGQSFGETALLAEEKRSATVRTLKPTICAVLSRSQFQQLIVSIPEIALAVCRYLAVRLAAQCKLTGIRFLSADDLRYNARAYQLFAETLLDRCEAIPIDIKGRTVTVALTRPSDPLAIELLRKEIPGMGLEPVGCTREDYEYFRTRRAGNRTKANPVYQTGKISLHYADGGRLCSSLRRLLEVLLTRGLDYAFVETSKTSLVARPESKGQPLLESDSPTEIQEFQEELQRLLDGGSVPYHHGDTNIFCNGHRVLMSLSVLNGPDRKRYSVQLSDGSRQVPPLENLILSQPLLRATIDAVFEPSGVVLLEGPRGEGLSTSMFSLLQHYVQVTGPDKALLFEEEARGGLEGITSWPLSGSLIKLVETAQRQRAGLLAIDRVESESLEHLLAKPLAATTVLAVYQDPQALYSRLRQLAQTSTAGFRALRLVLRQRLAFRVCDGCRHPITVAPAEMKLLSDSGLSNQTGHYFRGIGCEACGFSGIAGRIPVFEAVRFSGDLLDHFRTDGPALSKELRACTVVSFQSYAHALIAQGTIDPTEGLRLFCPATASFSVS